MDSQKRVERKCSQFPTLVISVRFAVAMFLLFLLLPHFHAQSLTPIRIDASQPYREPEPAPYDGGTATSSSGGTLAINSRYLTRDGRPWLPVMGEFHFTRYPESRWEEELLKMKAAGVEIVATYIFWIHQEEIEGQFDWKGQRDLRSFAQLCARHGMYLEPRIGPWDHGEVRNGGIPDWLLKKGPTRVNDPIYLSYVRAWYGQIAQQLKGLLWKDGGPVIGIQLENEYSSRGPGAGEEHILELKKLAIESGLDVPLYLVTGWDNAVVPERAVIPVYGGGYPDAPWDASPVRLPPAEVYAFRFQSRVAANMGAMGGSGQNNASASAQEALPYLTAEIGGGIEDTYHRRPVIHPDDIGAMFPVMLGSGANLYGSYMFQGGENPDGKLSTLQESQATGYPNDVPVKSYDFQAPLGEFGDERASLRKMKIFQYFLNDFGEYLAPMMVHAPDKLPTSPEDFSVARAAVRSRGDSGFIFLNNYVRNYSMPERSAAQFEIRLPNGVLPEPISSGRSTCEPLARPSATALRKCLRESRTTEQPPFTLLRFRALQWSSHWTRPLLVILRHRAGKRFVNPASRLSLDSSRVSIHSSISWLLTAGRPVLWYSRKRRPRTPGRYVWAMAILPAMMAAFNCSSPNRISSPIPRQDRAASGYVRVEHRTSHSPSLLRWPFRLMRV
jgi:beta-galactosidase